MNVLEINDCDIDNDLEEDANDLEEDSNNIEEDANNIEDRDPLTDSVQIVDSKDLDYSTFFRNYMFKNIPCIIKNVTRAWNSNEQWIRNDMINHEYFIKHYGNLEAPVADCNTIEFNAHSKSIMKVKDYMNYLRSPTRERVLYLKDWHLRRLKPEDSFYEVPIFFGSDWLNEFAKDHNEDDFMFVYIGPTTSWTPIHVDVYNSYSWSVNVVGRKKWILFPPGEEEKLKDSLGNLPLLFTKDKYPNVKYLDISQDRGEALFVPSGWHHQVENVLDTISINHNWVNACNIEAVWVAMQNCLQCIENEIKDIKDSPDFISQCQIILKSLFGMDFLNYVNFVSHIAKKRVDQLRENKKTSNKFELGSNHLKFDLKTLLRVMNLVEKHTLFSSSCSLSTTKKCDFIDIKNVIQVLLSS